jgi:hypothetical protein
MRPFFQLRLFLFRNTLAASNLGLCELFCILHKIVQGFRDFTIGLNKFRGKKMFYLLTANKCGLNHKKPGLNFRNFQIDFS